LFSVYNTASNALMVAQEGERRAHGFDYRDQRKAANADAQDHTRKAKLMTEISGLIAIITDRRRPEIVEGEFRQHTDDDEGPAASSDSPGSGAAQFFPKPMKKTRSARACPLRVLIGTFSYIREWERTIPRQIIRAVIAPKNTGEYDRRLTL
jgi:hypothetical protein